MTDNKFDMIATTFFGLEPVLAEELKTMGASNIQTITRAVYFRGDNEVLYRANLWSRTALKILVPIRRFNAYNDKEFYDLCFRIDWQRYMAVSDTFAVDCVASGPIFTHSKYLALKCKDAIADYFRDKRGRRPNVDVEYPDLRINVHVYNAEVSISIDSTGIPMSKRGYKARQTVAPLNEVMAAGILKLAGWDMQTPLIDPMCGSGTFATEACMMAMNIAPGSYRHFAFEKWRDFDRDIWVRLKQEQKDLRKQAPGVEIAAYDRDPQALDIASQNIENAGFQEFIDLDRKDFFRTEGTIQGKFLVMNPPYGERLEEQDKMVEFYKNIGNVLKSNYTDSQAWVLSGNLEAIKKLGLHPSKKIKLFNGPIECRLECFEVYDGSRRNRRKENI
ncbi:MAG: THUMP domain-containing protein [Bacteroidales bacterium]|nr:THUMP domain-containing protein [Bacteroidales bacterium]